MNDSNQLIALDKMRASWSIVRSPIGAALGSTIYILFAKIVMDQPAELCDPGTIRLIIEATLLPASLLVAPSFPRDDPLILYLLSSLPYAMLGSFIFNSEIITAIVWSIFIVFCSFCSFLFLVYALVQSCGG